jgi:large subunit ribosomal protein L10
VNRQEKVANVADLRSRLTTAGVALLTEYRGFTVADLSRLRRQLREVNGEYRVAKNRLLRHAIVDTPFVSLSELLKGQNGLALGYGDPVALVKVVTRYAREQEKLVVKGGVAQGSFIPPQELEEVARIPSREALISRLLGLIQASATQLLRTIQEPGAGLARLLAAVHKSEKAP